MTEPAQTFFSCNGAVTETLLHHIRHIMALEKVLVVHENGTCAFFSFAFLEAYIVSALVSVVSV
jgi:hypothetical protein